MSQVEREGDLLGENQTQEIINFMMEGVSIESLDSKANAECYAETLGVVFRASRIYLNSSKLIDVAGVELTGATAELIFDAYAASQSRVYMSKAARSAQAFGRLTGERGSFALDMIKADAQGFLEEYLGAATEMFSFYDVFGADETFVSQMTQKIDLVRGLYVGLLKEDLGVRDIIENHPQFIGIIGGVPEWLKIGHEWDSTSPRTF